MKTLLDLYFAYVAQFIYNRATYMIMINSLQIYEFVCMYNARFLLYRNNTGTIHTYMYNLQIVIYRDTSPLHGHLVTKYLQIFKIQGFGYFQEDDIQLPGFYTNIPPSEFETSAPHQTQTGTPSRYTPLSRPLNTRLYIDTIISKLSDPLDVTFLTKSPTY